MIQSWTVLLVTFAYVCALFAVAHVGETSGRQFVGRWARPAVYALSIPIYCTSWTFYGSVGLASTSGLDFLPIYIGPFLVFVFGQRLLRRIVRLAKSQNITSVADFVAARYGKAESVSAGVALIALIGTIPYVALQLKAISGSLSMVIGSIESGKVTSVSAGAGSALIIALLLAGFSIIFGTRAVKATEHQDGLMLAIAAESVVKLLAFLIVGAFVTWGMFGGIGDLTNHVVADPRIESVLTARINPATWITTTLLSACAIVLLPRQFHVTIVENRDERDIKTAAWLFPFYLVAINLFVVPLAIAGLIIFPDGGIPRDMTVLALPLSDQASLVALIGLIGGISAATAMVIVASVAVSIMVSNDLVMPLALRWRASFSRIEPRNLGAMILFVRRLAIVMLVLLGYAYLRFTGDAALASIGLLAFAAVAQIAPAFLGGLIWPRANARGALGGLTIGTLVWAYTLFLPSLDTGNEAIRAIVTHGPLGFAGLKPTNLFGLGLPALSNGVLWSLAANVLAFIGLSLSRAATPIEQLQANIFIGAKSEPLGQSLRLWRTSVTIGEVEAAAARYLGQERTRRAFETFMAERGMSASASQEADISLVRFAEHLLASAIGAASSRLVLSLLLQRRNVSPKAALQLVDDASAALQHNRDLLQHALDHARQGVTVFDNNLQLMCWNREYRDMFDLPNAIMRVGTGLETIVRFKAGRGMYGAGDFEQLVSEKAALIANEGEPQRIKIQPHGPFVEIRSARLPDGGFVTTYSDISASVQQEEALEQRVQERTRQLETLNAELTRARAEADDANLSKTRFLAAASHDILQPLNAARLYATSLADHGAADMRGGNASPAILARNIDASLEAVEDILNTLLDISRLDAGATKPEISDFMADDILRQLRLEFLPVAQEKGLKLTFAATSLGVRSDRRLLRRLLQNLISNAIKYTKKGSVLVGVRRRGDRVRLEVWDTGSGIPASKQKLIFQEFQRLDEGARAAPGLGLGLSIVERLGRLLDHSIDVRSIQGKGSVFAADVPFAAKARRAAPEARERAQARVFDLSGLSVLAIDNEPRILDGLDVLLTGWGCKIALAGSLAEAERVTAMPDQQPDVILADYHLGTGDGLAAIAALRARFGASLPAILMTADRSQAIAEAAAAADVQVMHKPVKPGSLRALLSRWRQLRAAAE